MSQLFPTIYISFDGFQRRQLKQELHRAFNQSTLSALGFKLKLSPRSVIDFGTPDPQLAGEQSKQSSLFVALLEEVAGHGSRQQMLHTELGHAIPEEGTEVLLLSEAMRPGLPDALARLLGPHAEQCQRIEGDLAPAIMEQVEKAISGTQSEARLELLPDDYSVLGYQPQQAPQSEPSLKEILNPQQNQTPQSISPELANLQQHHQWLMENLTLANPLGAEQSVKHCLSLYDSDITANYWRCRLLVDKASKESEYTELCERARLVQRHLQRQGHEAPELMAECYYYQAQGYVGLQQLQQAIEVLQQALAEQTNVALLYQLALRTLQLLAQQQTPPERQDPSLMAAKQTCLKMLQHSLLGYQQATQQLLMKTPKDKLEMVILGVKQDVISSVRQLQQQEQELKQLCADWELIVTPQIRSEQMVDLLQKSVWNLVQIGQASIKRQLALLQLLAQQVHYETKRVQRLEHESAQLEQDQHQLHADLEKLRFNYQDTCKSRQLSWWGLAATGLLMSTLISGFWWMSLSQTALFGLLGGHLVAFALLALLLKKQSSSLVELKQTCRQIDGKHALVEDELPEPRAQEGWFDRLAVRHDKLRDRSLKIKAELKAAKAQWIERVPQLAQAQFSFSVVSLDALGGTFNPWQADDDKALKENLSHSYALPEEVVTSLQSELPEPPIWHILSRSAPEQPWCCYFAQEPDLSLFKDLHLLQVAANTEPMTETLLAPQEEQWQLNKWLVAEGDAVEADQPIAELQNQDETLALFAPRAGRVNRQFAQEGHDLLPEQAVVELDVS